MSGEAVCPILDTLVRPTIHFLKFTEHNCMESSPTTGQRQNLEEYESYALNVSQGRNSYAGDLAENPFCVWKGVLRT